jgi:FAD synthetase
VLLLAALSPHRMSPTAKIPAVYVMCTNPFGEVDDFVDTCIDDYALDLYRYLLPMKSAFASYLSKNSSVKAIFVGTRRTDPHGRFLTHFDPTDKGWPQFMRIHPVINWRYQEIWSVSFFVPLFSITYTPSPTDKKTVFKRGRSPILQAI